MKRLLDALLSLLGLSLGAPLLSALFALSLLDTGSPLTKGRTEKSLQEALGF
jgi:lipopolysaccharide/colanic/teichoic acid biosynthesis glycosyltransferase